MTTEKYFKIEGIVCDENQQGLAGLIVEALDKDFLCDDRLGSTRTDDNGHFEIAYSKADFSMFFEQKPDIYLRVKEADGTVIHTTENKVRYEAGRTEEFSIEINRASLLISSSEMLVNHIIRDEKLLVELSTTIGNILEEHKVFLAEGLTYTFVPNVVEIPANLDLSRLRWCPPGYIGKWPNCHPIFPHCPPGYIGMWPHCFKIPQIVVEPLRIWPPCPCPGPIDPRILVLLDEGRIWNQVSEIFGPNPSPVSSSEEFARRISSDQALMTKLSDAVKKIFNKSAYNVVFKQGMTYALTPVVYPKPIFVHELLINSLEESEKSTGFTPQVMDSAGFSKYHLLLSTQGIFDPELLKKLLEIAKNPSFEVAQRG